MRVKWLLGTTLVAAGAVLAAGSAQAVDLTIVLVGRRLHGKPAEGLPRPLYGG